MTTITLKSLHAYLGVVETAYKLKRKALANTNPRSLREGLVEMSRLVGLEDGSLDNPQNIAALIGNQRFVTILGEPSATAHVARIFDSTKALMTVLMDPAQPVPGAPPGSPSIMSTQSNANRSGAESESALDNLKPVLTGNLALSSRLFRVLFEHLLGFATPPGPQPSGATPANEASGGKEQGRCLLAVQLHVLGAEVDPAHLLAFMSAQGLLGIQSFEQLLQNRDYCDAYYTFRRLERAFIASPAEEEAQLRNRVDKFVAQFGGKPTGTKIFDATDQDKARIDAHLAAFDLIVTMAMTPWSLGLHEATSALASMCVSSIKTMARQFEQFAAGVVTKEQANKEIADHLLAFIRQFAPVSMFTANP